MTRENEKKARRGSRKLLAVAGIIIISLAAFSQGCSSRHSMITSPFEETELASQDTTVDFSFQEVEEDEGITGAYSRVGSQVLDGFSQMLFSATDSLSQAGK